MMSKKLSVCKLAVLGVGGVGKTALISRFRSKTFVEDVSASVNYRMLYD
jgi:GTPase SAR1 family protein